MQTVIIVLAIAWVVVVVVALAWLVRPALRVVRATRAAQARTADMERFTAAQLRVAERQQQVTERQAALNAAIEGARATMAVLMVLRLAVREAVGR